MKNQIINACKAHFTGKIEVHKTNIDVMLNNPTAIHDHSNITGAIEEELAIIAEYEDKLAVLVKYFT